MVRKGDDGKCNDGNDAYLVASKRLNEIGHGKSSYS